MGRRVFGASKVRRKLKRLPDAITGDLRRVIASESHEVLQGMRHRVHYSGLGLVEDWEGKPRQHLRDALEVRISKDGLSARVGLMGKRSRKQLFFAKFLEFGFRHKGGKFIKLPFIFPAWRERRDKTRARVKQSVIDSFEKTTR